MVCNEDFHYFLNRLPAYPKCVFHDVPVDLDCLKQLNQVCKKMKPIDRIISFFREEGMMTANPPGGSGGFSGSADPKGPRAGLIQS